MNNHNDITMLDIDILIHIFEFLEWREILLSRVCREWREIAKKTLVPYNHKNHTQLLIWDSKSALDMDWISKAIPKIQVIQFQDRDFAPYVADGINPYPTPMSLDEQYEHWFYDDQPPSPPVDISPIANFHHLVHLSIQTYMNGSYPFLFEFPQLQSLQLKHPGNLQWDLSMLKGLPKLQTLHCIKNSKLTGNLKSIRVLRNSLVNLCLSNCQEVKGILADLKDFPKLEKLNLEDTKVTGDIRNIGPQDFISMEEMDLGHNVYGGKSFFSIREAPEIMLGWYRLKKRRPKVLDGRQISLSQNSSEWYELHNFVHKRKMPTDVEFVKAGCRLGWRWTNGYPGGSCEIHWLDPEPHPSEDGYGEYIRAVAKIQNNIDFFHGFLVPPTEEEYRRRSAEKPQGPMLTKFSVNGMLLL